MNSSNYATGQVDLSGWPVVDPTPLMSDAELNDAEEVEEADKDGDGDLPHKTEDCNEHAWQRTKDDAGYDDEGVDSDIYVREICCEVDQVRYNL